MLQPTYATKHSIDSLAGRVAPWSPMASLLYNSHKTPILLVFLGRTAMDGMWKIRIEGERLKGRKRENRGEVSVRKFKTERTKGM